MTRGLLQSDDGPLEPVEQASTLEAVGLCSADVRDTASQFTQSSIIRLNEQLVGGRIEMQMTLLRTSNWNTMSTGSQWASGA